MKQNHMAVSERNLMEFVKPAISCPIECNLLLVCVLISCGFQKAACPRAPGVEVASHLAESPNFAGRFAQRLPQWPKYKAPVGNNA
jgi:hypothetical protein